MKNISVLVLFICSFMNGQFTVKVKMDNFLGKSVLLSKLDGSKYVILDTKKINKRGSIKVSESYVGMMKLYWPESSQTIHFISENKNVSIDLKVKDNKVSDVKFLDSSNFLMNSILEKQKKNEYIFPALVQIQPYYKANSDFYKALDNEINRLSKTEVYNKDEFPFVNYYETNYKKYLVTESTGKDVTKDQIRDFISSTNEMLESSSLLKPLLINYLNDSRNDIDGSVDELLSELQIDTPRGQTVLSELIDLFSSFGMTDQEAKYLSKAKGLKCSINERLSSTLKIHKDTQIGALFPNYTFTKRVTNTKAKTLHDISAEKKVIVFWSSGCMHCKKDLPELLKVYSDIKAKNIKIIGLSIDVDKSSYFKEIKPFPWINDTELMGWDSSFSETYNINGTPTYFILDKNNKIISKPSRVNDVLKFIKKH